MSIKSSTPAEIFKPESLQDYQVVITETPKMALETVLSEQIVSKSKQGQMLKSVPNDSAVRFKDEDSLEKWSEKGKLIFCLMMQDDLGGLIWFSKSENKLAPNAETTFAIRLYDEYRGKGLAKPFMTLSHFLLPKLMDVSGNTWLETDMDNSTASSLYSSFGYVDAGISDEGRRVMEYYSISE